LVALHTEGLNQVKDNHTVALLSLVDRRDELGQTSPAFGKPVRRRATVAAADPRDQPSALHEHMLM
jgi:hypothetical protein